MGLGHNDRDQGCTHGHRKGIAHFTTSPPQAGIGSSRDASGLDFDGFRCATQMAGIWGCSTADGCAVGSSGGFAPSPFGVHFDGSAWIEATVDSALTRGGYLDNSVGGRIDLWAKGRDQHVAAKRDSYGESMV